MRALLAALRISVYLMAGALVGFLFLAEFALGTVVVVQLGLTTLTLAGLAGVLRRWRALELWPLFVAAALALPLSHDASIVALPRCGAVPPGVACFAGTRDVVTPFVIESMTFVIALASSALLIAREWRTARRDGRIDAAR